MPVDPLWPAAAVFVLTYTLIAVPRLRGVRIEKAAVALLGAGLMVLLGVLGPAEALASITQGTNVIVLLLGMMLMVAGLEACGFFELVSHRIAERSTDQRRLLGGLMVVTAALSALVLNDTIVLLFTPIIVRSCRVMAIDPLPYLIGEAMAANIGSVAMEVGNPQNAYIAGRSGIPFATWTAALLPLAALSLVVAYALLVLLYRRSLAAPIAVRKEREPVRVHWRGLMFDLAVLNGAVAIFFLGTPSLLPWVAFVGGALVLFLLPFLGVSTHQSLLRRVDWSILVFFLGLFVVLGGVEVSGLLDRFVSVLGLGGNPGGTGSVLALSAVLSNAISNVPAVLFLAPIVETTATTKTWLLLGAGSTLAGNATILGAAANVIVVEQASERGVELSFKEFARAGVPIAAATLALTWLYFQFLPLT